MGYLRGPGGWIAHQVWGAGDIDVLWLSNWGTSVDNMWDHPARIRFLAFHGSLGQVTHFDPRGHGPSDPLPSLEGDLLAAWVEDALVVLDALESRRVVVVAELLATHVALRLAALEPRRVERLALWNTWCEPLMDDEELVDRIAEVVGAGWGEGSFTAAAVPSLHAGAQPGFFARNERLALSRAAATAMMATMLTSDIRRTVQDVCQPALVVYSGDVPAITREQSEIVAELLPGGRFLESDTRSFYWGDHMAAYGEFITGRTATAAEREVGTVVFTDIVGSTDEAVRTGDPRWREVLDGLDDFVAIEVHRNGGTTVKQTGDGHLMTFLRPSAAVHAADTIVRGARAFGVRLRAGIHAGEFERRRAVDITGVTVHVAARIASLAGPDEIMLSRTVVDLLGGHRLRLDDRGAHPLKGVPGEWSLYALVVD